jgi:hypothetical protein
MISRWFGPTKFVMGLSRLLYYYYILDTLLVCRSDDQIYDCEERQRYTTAMKLESLLNSGCAGEPQ